MAQNTVSKALNGASIGANRTAQMAVPVTSPLLLSMGIRDREVLGWIQVKAPLLLSIGLQPIRDARAAANANQEARVRRIGRDHQGVVDGQNYGHSIRQSTLYDHAGALLRGPDVVVDEAGDPAEPNRTLRRARRVDPLRVLTMTSGGISGTEFDAAEALRDDMERALTPMPTGTVPGARTPPWDRNGISEAQRIAMVKVRRAMAIVPERDRLTLLWLLAGGTVDGCAKLRRLHHRTVTKSLRAALAELVVHYGLGKRRAS